MKKARESDPGLLHVTARRCAEVQSHQIGRGMRLNRRTANPAAVMPAAMNRTRIGADDPVRGSDPSPLVGASDWTCVPVNP
jgi:hypothetical protein